MLQFKKSIMFMFMFTIPQFLRLEFVIAIIIPDRYLSVCISTGIDSVPRSTAARPRICLDRQAGLADENTGA
jgi:hypothetical protein